MAIAKMEKINIVGIQQDKLEIMKQLQKLGCAEIIEPNKKLLSQILGENVYFSGKEKLEFDIAELKFAIDFLSRYDTKNKQGMIQSFMGDLIKVEKNEFEKNKKIDYIKIVKDIKIIETQLLIIQRSKEKIKQQLEVLREWSNLSISIKDLKSLENYTFVLGSLPINNWHSFLKKLESVEKVISVEKVRSTITEDKFQKLILIYPNKPVDISKKINQILNEFNFTSAESLIKFDNKIIDEITKLKEDDKNLSQEKSKLENQIKTFLPQKLNLMCVYDYLSWQENLRETEQKTISTKKTFILSAWVRTDQFEQLKKQLSKISQYISINIVKPEKNEEPPVTLKNSKFIEPFEAVTNIYGMPKYSEPDPTLWLAPFFILFFALCLTDAGYGLIIIIITHLMLKKWNYLLIRVLNYGGYATLVVGALTGGWFGIQLDLLPWPWLANTLIAIRLVDPIKDPIVMMILALSLGVIQIFVGIACKMYWKLIHKQVKNALLDELPWLYLLITIICFALAKMEILFASRVNLWQTLLCLALIIIILTQGRKQKNILMKPLSGAMRLYDLIGFLSDTLSYARLLALGLATAIIAFVVNMIASLFKGVPIVGFILFAVILIGGHTFNLGINLLGSFIHSARLQYVEFFSKFMEGGGRRFKPFSRKNIYVDIK